MSAGRNKSLEVALVGRGMSPNRIPVSSLVKILSSVQRLGSGASPWEKSEDEEEAVDKALSHLRLTDVKKGSAVFSCYVDQADAVYGNLRTIDQVLQGRDDDSIDRLAYGYSSLKILGGVCRQYDCQVKIRLPGTVKNPGQSLLVVDADSVARVESELIIHGETSVAATIERAGGKTAKVMICVEPSRQRLYCEVKNDAERTLVKTLAQNLYRLVGLSGEATWIRSNWRLIDLKITGASIPTTQSWREHRAEFMKIAGKGQGWGRFKDISAARRRLLGE